MLALFATKFLNDISRRKSSVVKFKGALSRHFCYFSAKTISSSFFLIFARPENMKMKWNVVLRHQFFFFYENRNPWYIFGFGVVTGTRSEANCFKMQSISIFSLITVCLQWTNFIIVFKFPLMWRHISAFEDGTKWCDAWTSRSPHNKSGVSVHNPHYSRANLFADAVYAQSNSTYGNTSLISFSTTSMSWLTPNVMSTPTSTSTSTSTSNSSTQNPPAAASTSTSMPTPSTTGTTSPISVTTAPLPKKSKKKQFVSYQIWEINVLWQLLWLWQ